jgi:hypothetical protein
MNSQQAKFILQAYRHQELDAADPHFAEALAQVNRDPDLSQWLTEDHRLYALCSAGLRRIPVPPDLKAHILAGCKVIRPVPWWRQPSWLAATAALLLAFVAGGFWLTHRGHPDLATFRRDMSAFLSTQLTYLDHYSASVGGLQQWLSQYDTPADFTLPPGLRKLPGIGCRILKHEGRNVTLICFRLENGAALHLFVVDRPAWRSLPPPAHPHFQESGLWMTAAWREGDKAFMLAGKSSEDEMKKLF